jgi:hypothetical protein
MWKPWASRPELDGNRFERVRKVIAGRADDARLMRWRRALQAKSGRKIEQGKEGMGWRE